MNKTACWLVVALLGGTAAHGQRELRDDPSAPESLITWRDPAQVQAGLVYSHVSRMVDVGGVESKFRADAVDAQIGVSPWSWLLLYGQAGASDGRLRDAMSADASTGAGGLLGVRLNLWQVFEGVQVTSWRFTVKLAGEYSYRTAEDDGSGSLAWSEALVALPLDYYLSFSRTYRHLYLSELHGMSIYGGPAFSQIEGTWERRGTRRDFDEADSFGAVAGADLWLLRNLCFGARLDWFEESSMQVNVRYRF